MSRLTKWLLPLFVLGLLATFGQGAPVVICTETAQGGCVAAIPTSDPPLMVASDGESTFDPFGAGYDISDGIQLNANWAPDPAYAAAFAPGFWTQLPGTFTWVLPAVTPCGIENEPSCEPIAGWYFAAGGQWDPETPDILYILEPSGSISDIILVNNSGPGGSAAIIFSSDPNLVPEPGTLTLLGLGLGFAAVAKRLRKKSA
jgi:hypothetical protein